MSLHDSFIAQEGRLSTDDSSSQPDSSKIINNSFVILKPEEEAKKLKKSAKRSTIDAILEEFRAERNDPLALPPPAEYPNILKNVLRKLPDAYPEKRKAKESSYKFNNLRKAQIFREAPFLYFEKPKHLVERDSGFTGFISHNYEHLVITKTNISKNALFTKLELIQQCLMHFGVPYSEWTGACLVCFRDAAAHRVMGTPGFDSQMPWGHLLIQLTAGVSVKMEFDLKTFINEENFEENDLVGPLIKQKIKMIKEAPMHCDKHEALLLLKIFVHRHIWPLSNPDFVPSIANFEEIEDAISKLMIKFNKPGKDTEGFNFSAWCNLDQFYQCIKILFNLFAFIFKLLLLFLVLGALTAKH